MPFRAARARRSRRRVAAAELIEGRKRRMLEGFSNASRIPELRRRLLFTAAMLAVYRIGVAVPTPGIDGQALAAFFDAASSTLFGWVNLFSGGALRAVFDFRPRHHALYLGRDHSRPAQDRLALSRRALQRGRGGAAQNHPVHALRHRRARDGAGHDDRLLAWRTCRRPAAAPWSIIPGFRVYRDDRDYASPPARCS